MNTQQLDHTYIANTYARYPVTIVRGKGSLVWDENGKEYIDLATGIAVNSFGVSDPAWVRAVTEQLCTVQHTSNLYFTAPDAQLAQLLCEKTGMKKVFFSNSGAEANEAAFKIARRTGRPRVLAAVGGLHPVGSEAQQPDAVEADVGERGQQQAGAVLAPRGGVGEGDDVGVGVRVR